MHEKSDLNEKVFKEKLKTLLDEDNDIKKWNEGLLIKSFILLPILIFIIGLLIINRPENLLEVLFTLLYPLVLISIGLITLFFMIGNFK